MGDTNRKNNSVRKDLTVNASDLIVCIKHKDTALKGTLVIITTKVRNIGKAPSLLCKLMIYVHRKGFQSFTIPELAPGKTFVVIKRIRWLHTGTMRIEAGIDSKNEVYESNEKNNVVKGSIYIKHRFDDNYTDTTKIVCSNGTQEY